jgi:predicted transcriptional regulator
LYRANLNFYQLTKYLDLLLRFNMIQEVESPFHGYRTTEKGLQFLGLFESLDMEGRAILVHQIAQ